MNRMERRIREFFLTWNQRDIPYIAEVTLRVPVLVLIHLWMLFSPDSEYWILSLPCFVMRYGGSLLLFETSNYTRTQLVFFYVCATPLLFFAPVINSLHENVENLASGESTFKFTRLLLATIAFFLFIFLFQKLYVPPESSILLWLPTFVILVLIGFVWLLGWNIFVSLVYWVSRLIFIAIYLRIVLMNSDGSNRGMGKIADTVKQYVSKDIFSIFGLSYYTYAITCELQYGMPLQDLASIQGLNHIISKWCTSIVVLHSIVSMFVFIGNVIIIMTLHCMINEGEDRPGLRPLIYIGKANNLLIPFHVFALQAGVLRLDEEVKADVVSALLYFTLVAFLIYIFLMLEPFLTSLGANAAERQLRVHIRVVIFISSIVVCSISVSLNIVDRLEMGVWSVLSASGCLLLVTRAILTFMEYTVNMISWFYDMDLTRTQDIIYYISLSKSISIIICSLLEGYHKLFFSLFSQNIFWLIVRALMILLAQIGVSVPILLLEYAKHVQRTKSRAVVNSLPIATPEQVANLDDVCAICMDEIHEGLVTPCEHIFHSECLRKASAIRHACPMCNQPFYENTNVITKNRDLEPQIN